MLKVAITGNIAAGKSEVEKLIAQAGYTVFDTDKMAHEILGNVDRKKLGDIVFRDNEAKKKLEAYIHPIIKSKLEEIFKQNIDVVFVSVPLLFETDFYKLFDKTLLVMCDDNIRLNRLIKRNNFTKEEALLRMNAQIPQEEKIKKADFIIENNSSLSVLETDVKAFLKNLV